MRCPSDVSGVVDLHVGDTTGDESANVVHR